MTTRPSSKRPTLQGSKRLIGASLAASLSLVAVMAAVAAIRADQQGAAPAKAPTFAADVAPIIYANCAGCHRPGQSAPFALLTYADVTKRGKVISDAVMSGYMPPWHAKRAAGFPELKDERGLTPQDLSTLLAWIDAGMPAGDLSKAPKPPTFREGWTLGQPDLVLKLEHPIDVPADGPDLYRNVALTVDLPDDRWVKGIDYQPSARSVVHHAIFFTGPADAPVLEDEIVPGLAALRASLGAAGRGAAGSAAGAGLAGEAVSGLGGWVPGITPHFMPDGIAQPLPKHTNVILQMHLHPSGRAEREDGAIALYLTKTPPQHSLTTVQVPPGFGFGLGIDIAAGQKDWVLRDSVVLPVDVTAYGARGHAHYLCRTMKMTATLPDGTTRGLLWIDDWNFNWQDSYFYTAPFALPRGARIDTELHYDNSIDNLRNPNSPAKRVRWGQGSLDEMGSMSLLVTTATQAETQELKALQALRLRNQVIARLTGRQGLAPGANPQ